MPLAVLAVSVPKIAKDICADMYEGNVLVIDDDAGRAQELADTVEKVGFDAQIATDTINTSLSLSGDSELDVILCEMGLKDFPWKQASHARRKMDVQIPAIMLSDRIETDRIMVALRLGASDFFVRPFDVEALFKSLSQCVRQRQLHRELKGSATMLERANRELKNTIKILEQDQQAGRQVQLAMLPESPMTLDYYSFSHKIIPSLYLSGDFADYFTVGDRQVVFFLADVSGHGSSSAFATVLMKNLFARKRSDFFRRNDDTIQHPGKMLERTNKEFLNFGIDKFATMIVGVIDIVANSLTYSVAGHLPLPILFCPGKEPSYLDGEGSPVGLISDAVFDEHFVSLPEKFALSLFSDGILEMLPPSDLLSKEAYFLEMFGRCVSPEIDIFDRLGLLDSKPVAPDDIAGLFISRST